MREEITHLLGRRMDCRFKDIDEVIFKTRPGQSIEDLRLEMVREALSWYIYYRIFPIFPYRNKEKHLPFELCIEDFFQFCRYEKKIGVTISIPSIENSRWNLWGGVYYAASLYTTIGQYNIMTI